MSERGPYRSLDEVSERLFGPGAPRVFPHYKDLISLLGDEDQVVLVDLHPVAAPTNILDGQNTPPFMALGSLCTASNTLHFGYQSEDNPRPIVLKSPSWGAEPKHVSRFHREETLLRDLRGNPLWVQSLPDYDGLEDGIVMESLLPGLPLKYLMEIYPELIDENPALVATILRQIAQALEPLHQRGIVHRDVKLDNVVLLPPDDEGNIIKLLDPGVARFPDLPRLTSPGGVVGTVGYIAPEQLIPADYDHRVDVYAVGAVGYNLLARRMLYSDVSQIRRPVDKISLHGQPSPLVDLILRMVSLSPGDRPADLYEVIAELDSMKDSLDSASRYSAQGHSAPYQAVLPSISDATAHDFANSLARMAMSLGSEQSSGSGVGQVLANLRGMFRRIIGLK